jgi:predicted Zn-dependent protease
MGAFILGGILLICGLPVAMAQTKPPLHQPIPAGASAEFKQVAKQATEAREANQLDRAVVLYREALKLNPRWDEGWWYLGTIYYDRNQYSRGVVAFRNLVELDANYGQGWALLGLCEFETHDYKNSLIHLQMGMAKGLGGVAALINATKYHEALIENMRGGFEEARATLSTLVANGVLSDVVKFALGMALLRVPLLPNQVDPSKDALINQAGEVGELIALEDYDQAGAAFQKLVKDYPTTPFVHYAYGSMLAQLARYDEAEKQFSDEIKINPGSAMAYMQLAFVDLRLSRDKEALPLSQKAVQIAPDSFVAHYLFGRSLLGTGQVQEAIKELEVARKLDPFSPEVRYSLAQALARGKRPNAAARQRAEFVRLNTLLQKSKAQLGSAGQSYRMSNSRGELSPHSVQGPAGTQSQ